MRRWVTLTLQMVKAVSPPPSEANRPPLPSKAVSLPPYSIVEESSSVSAVERPPNASVDKHSVGY